MTNRDTQQAFARVLEQCAASTGPAMGIISADVALLRVDHAERMRRAEATIAETARIVAALPPRRPAATAESPARRRLKEKLTIAAARVAGLNLTLQLETVRRRLEPPNTN